MLSRDERMQPGLVDSPNLAQGFGFAGRELFLRPGGFQKPTRWDFVRAVTQGWDIMSVTSTIIKPLAHKATSYVSDDSFQLIQITCQLNFFCVISSLITRPLNRSFSNLASLFKKLCSI